MFEFVPTPPPPIIIKWDEAHKFSFCEDNSIIVIGYRVRLTASEYKILKLIHSSDRGLSAEEIIEGCLKHKDITRGNISVHIHNINKKVHPVTQRKLVASDRINGYKIVEYI